MNKIENQCVINSLNNLSKLRLEFSPKRLVQCHKLIKISNDTIIVDLSPIIDKMHYKIDLENALKFVYNGHCCIINEKNIFEYSIYFTILKDNLIGGIFHKPTGKKLTSINIIGDTCPQNINDGQFLYSANDAFVNKIKEKLLHI